MQYMLMIAGDEVAENQISEADMGQIIAAYAAYSTALVEAGVMVMGERLQPANTATTVRIEDGKQRVLDGPYAETKEQLGGFYIIDVPDLDAALTWAARCPGANYGSIEVRPIWKM